MNTTQLEQWQRSIEEVFVLARSDDRAQTDLSIRRRQLKGL
ncbi:MAG: hypothetical protein ACXW32_13890 [Limisphaerales bacterium]